jgi:predicted branched-subunit amino acid permease
VFVGLGVGVLVGDERGTAMGVFAAAVFLPLFYGQVFKWHGLIAWFDAHPVADWALMSVLFFLAIALITEAPLAVCLAAGVAIATAFMLLVRPRQRRGRAAA